MQVRVTVIITTVLQTQPGLQASLPAHSVTGPVSMQSIYSNFTMKVHSVLWPAHTLSRGEPPWGEDAASSVLQRGMFPSKKWMLGRLREHKLARFLIQLLSFIMGLYALPPASASFSAVLFQFSSWSWMCRAQCQQRAPGAAPSAAASPTAPAPTAPAPRAQHPEPSSHSPSSHSPSSCCDHQQQNPHDDTSRSWPRVLVPDTAGGWGVLGGSGHTNWEKMSAHPQYPQPCLWAWRHQPPGGASVIYFWAN